MTDSDPITALGTTDPKKVSREEFVTLLEAASEAATDGGGVDLSSLGAEQFARLISRASTAQIEAVMARPELRENVLDEVFRRMGEHYKSDKARSTEAVVRWRIGTDEHDHLRYECVLSGGTCTVGKQPEHEPRATITLGPVEFLKLASGNASAPTLFMTGKLKVAGDVGFAAGLTKLFQIPKA
ncbi:SCP-2 sterol transfer family protein [Halopolyspora algeriensis]|uniref:SCP-2 sterol transfer family protein n=1 Tax=Halopolyspora algeriensis TaxID=1500506 RepID=A0A368VY38_9ACTN|nr:SCP2 sterol-binding domain-containing protein [Halopolyspora algeriensis]RCW47108.1 SCP-2 sterol transfer family protein [Halopolyspora algeriensis]TQM48195.1 SCP-2 sterol transfer family protein [Halopolyspora algeriensis]